MERVQDGKQAEAKALLEEGFARQANGTFSPEYLESCNPKMLALLNPEHMDEVKGIMARFGGAHTQP